MARRRVPRTPHRETPTPRTRSSAGGPKSNKRHASEIPYSSDEDDQSPYTNSDSFLSDIHHSSDGAWMRTSNPPSTPAGPAPHTPTPSRGSLPHTPNDRSVNPTPTPSTPQTPTRPPTHRDGFPSKLQRISTWELPDHEKNLGPPSRPIINLNTRLFQQDSDTMDPLGIWRSEPDTHKSAPLPLSRNALREANAQAALSEYLSDMSQRQPLPTPVPYDNNPGDEAPFDITDMLKALNSKEHSEDKAAQDISDLEGPGEQVNEAPTRRYSPLPAEEPGPDGKVRTREEIKKSILDGSFQPAVSMVDEADNPADAKKISKTLLSIFIWLMDHNISLTAYHSLVRIVQKDWFTPGDLPQSYTTIRNLRTQLPLIPLYSAEVPIMDKKGDSSTRDFTTAYFYKCKDVIEAQIRNPQLSSTMHRGLGIEVDRASEAYHGRIYKGSIMTGIRPM